VVVGGEDVTEVPPERRPVALLFQGFALFPHLDVANNIAFGMKRKHVPKDEIGRRTDEALELVHLTGYGKRKPNQLSGGQQQRVALARALVNRPNVLLLDEPLGALDLKLRKRLQIELKRIQSEVGITFVYVTHDQEEALTMSDRIAVMNRGKVEQLGTPEELYERPATRFVADFIGTTNLLHGTVEEVGPDGATVRLDSGDRCRVSGVGREAGQSVDLSLRPEAIAVRAIDGDGPAPDIEAVVEQVAYLGNAVQYVIRTRGGLGMTILSAKTGPRLIAEQGVALSWSPAEALVLGDRPASMEE
jgi:spermidine/putrescine transport system ATP-binding protein